METEWSENEIAKPLKKGDVVLDCPQCGASMNYRPAPSRTEELVKRLRALIRAIPFDPASEDDKWWMAKVDEILRDFEGAK